MSEELKPCPCCNSDATIIPHAVGRATWFHIECQHCGLRSAVTVDEAKAIAAWNKRIPLAGNVEE